MWRDAYSRRVVGWHLTTQMHLVLTALEQALMLPQPDPGRVMQADRGNQYPSQAYRQRLEGAGALANYARPGNPYDNARAEAG